MASGRRFITPLNLKIGPFYIASVCMLPDISNYGSLLSSSGCSLSQQMHYVMFLSFSRERENEREREREGKNIAMETNISLSLGCVVTMKTTYIDFAASASVLHS